MKVRIIGINEEERFDVNAAQTPPPTPLKAVVARFTGCDGNTFTYASVPVEMVRGAEVGDEFTLHLERVKK